ncbi:SAM-dependent methyltransferase [Streptomyces europaeiscabiei]|uniref:SAM-dependent methyltransferase n=1 Tax=Streptomyces europaeiscabiei TaxID=146819 RepID=A0ABU4NJ09_9ACTN|nr:SAM-dependent methyltransferase [Streptomyces europaeiscabiei]MDX3545877.1 SAM-dependent methyltransferase [Streptomyces europaeiscabiei]MDX3555566.1 SAM-dependent methyltransferase [Streptomyces europaeiscabiei]MDX3667123.1 SAM-dependent methyltransferase [Streptomyces europaeiscabiei]MDX3703120.1 SAM-dependent methyltransferase [Streptomyces europaeiscabiei]MDX3710927.1 SAM-dependent methyltransferase [Streptomyces europaeiscabiei]
MPLDRPVINSGVPHSARIWNYWLGGKDCYEIDRQVGDEIRGVNPQIVDIARAQRAFLRRTVTHLTEEAGLRQFLDIGTGLPTADNTHEVAQRTARDARIVYVDHDPTVLAHANALLTSTSEGATAFVAADLRDPDTILERAADTLDLTSPVALMLLGTTAHVPDESVYGIVTRLLDALPSGSHLVLGDSTEVYRPEAMRKMVEHWNETSDNPRVNRSPEQLTRFFDGLEPLEPGVVSVARWRAERGGSDEPWEVDCFGGVGRKP